MPYTHREVNDKECVFKKDTGKQVGCTTGDINDYLGALHANVKTEEEIEEGIVDIGREKMYNGLVGIKDSLKNESVRTSQMFKTIINSIKTGKQLTSEERIKLGEDLKNLLTKLGYGAVFMLPGGSVFILTYKLIKNRMSKNKENLTESNKLKGGKSDNMTIKDIANNFNVLVSDIKKQINKGEKVESEHTTDKEKQTEIATDHVSEFPDYYDRLEKLEKDADKYWKNKMTESKKLIKNILRENLEQPFTVEYFRTRIPFLKDYKFFNDLNNRGDIEAQRIVFHENIQRIYDQSVVTFPQFNPSSYFIYRVSKNNVRTVHYFSLKNSFSVSQPKNMDDLDFKIFLLMLKKVEENISFSDEIRLEDNEQLKTVDINRIINSMNEKMFKFEEFSANLNVPLF